MNAAEQMTLIYELWHRRTKFMSNPRVAVYENIHAHALLTFKKEELLPFLFSRFSDWGFFEIGLIAGCTDDLPDVSKELYGRTRESGKIYYEWGKQKGYV